MIDYIGSKKKLFEFIHSTIRKHMLLDKNIVFGDCFSGTGVVAQRFRCLYQCKTISCDTEKYSWLIQETMMNIAYSQNLEKWIEQLNQLECAQDGLFANTYSPRAERMFFTEQNALKIDSIRVRIKQLHESNEITQDEYLFLLASLIVSTDKVANKSCVYGSFLKVFKKSALKPFKLIPIHEEKHIIRMHNVYLDSVLNSSWDKCDIVYLDPPYNQRQYGANYFVLNYLIDYDPEKLVYGKTGLIEYYKSEFSQKTQCVQAFEKLFDKVRNVPLIVLSYNNEGLLSQTEVQNLLSKFGKVHVYTQSYKKFKAQKGVKQSSVDEFLWIVETKNN